MIVLSNVFKDFARICKVVLKEPQRDAGKTCVSVLGFGILRVRSNAHRFDTDGDSS